MALSAADKRNMPGVLAVLFWIWLAVSIVMLVKRYSARRAQQADKSVEIAEDGTAAFDPPTEDREPALAGAAPAPASPPVAPAPTPTTTGVPTPPPGFEQPAAPVVDRPSVRSAPAAGIADALVGIRMPCDLVPLVVDRLSTDKIALSTTGFPPEVVGQGLADEVERLGYVVRPLSDRDVIATRGATELRMTIHRAGADGRHHAHPNARDDSVVVEIALS